MQLHVGMRVKWFSAITMCGRDVFVEFCHQAHLSIKVDQVEDSGFTPDISHTRPANVLVQNWVGGKPAAFDFTQWRGEGGGGGQLPPGADLRGAPKCLDG